MFKYITVCLVFLNTAPYFTTCNSHVGPDPWDFMKNEVSSERIDDINVPPDLRMPLKKKTPPDVNMGNGEWFFKRALAIMLNGGQNKNNEDGSVDISIKMKFVPEQWQTLNEYTKSNIALSEDMFRRSIAYVEEAIYKPTITDRITMTWNEYIQTFIIANKMYIVWCFGILAAIGLTIWLWKHVSHKHIIIVIIIALYFYEVVISYKEAEKLELDRFLTAVSTCSWYFWKSSCEVAPPDPIIFMKHMNPIKIAIRMFTTIISEPMIAIVAIGNTMINDVTDKMWFPLNIIVHSILIIIINIFLIVLLIMIVYNYILNIPFNLNFILGSIQIKQRKRSINLNKSNDKSPQPVENIDRISSATLDKMLDVFSRALDSRHTPQFALNECSNQAPKLKRCSSTGRLPDSSSNYDALSSESNIRKRVCSPFEIGGGDSYSTNATSRKGKAAHKS